MPRVGEREGFRGHVLPDDWKSLFGNSTGYYYDWEGLGTQANAV